MNTPLVQQLNLLPDEVESMKKKIKLSIEVGRQKLLQEEFVMQIYDEWVTVAKRLKKGLKMIQQYEDVYPNLWELKQNEKFQKLSDLYDFLLAILGYYDTFFRYLLAEKHYRRLYNGVYEILTD